MLKDSRRTTSQIPTFGRVFSKLAAVPLFLLALGACMSLVGPSGVVEVRTDAEQYGVVRTPTGVNFQISLDILNHSERTIYLAACGGKSTPAVFLEKLDNGEWRTAIPTICPAIAASPIPVPRGDSFRYNRTFFGSTVEAVGPEFLLENVPGTYRLRVWIFTHGYGGEDTPPEEHISNTFTLVE